MTAVDNFAGNTPERAQPARRAEAVTPHDTNELTLVSRGLWVGGAGNVAVVMAEGDEVTFVGVSAGTLLPFCVKQVKATGTTATNIVAVS